jgi:hypothetical protein
VVILVICQWVIARAILGHIRILPVSSSNSLFFNHSLLGGSISRRILDPTTSAMRAWTMGSSSNVLISTALLYVFPVGWNGHNVLSSGLGIAQLRHSL